MRRQDFHGETLACRLEHDIGERAADVGRDLRIAAGPHRDRSIWH
jgi:hypothetical protein